MDTQLAVVGAGPGGYAAAFLAADLGMQVTLVNQEPRLGGVCLLRGCIPSKALLHVARTLAEAQQAAEWGVRFGEPAIDLATMRQRKEKVIDTLAGGLQQLVKRRKVQVVQAHAAFEDSHTLRLTPAADDVPADNVPADNVLRFEHCILATGSRPVLPAPFDQPSERVMDSTGALELGDVPERLLVVGGGYIGLEMGTVYAALGARVTVVELTAGLLPGVDRDLVKPLEKKLKVRFEAVYLNTRAAALTQRADAVEVQFEGEADPAVQQFDRVLVCVGRRPNSDGLGLENTQVEVDQQGFIQADEQQRTADPAILAIGDVAGQPMLAHKATHQGKVAAEVLAGGAAAFQPKAIPAVVFTDPEIAWAGLTRTQAESEGHAVALAAFPWAASGRAQAVGGTEGLTRWVIDAGSGRVLGCGIVGPGAGELVSEAVLAIELGAGVEDVAESIHPHPTLSETLGAAAEVYLGKATDLYRPRRKGR